ncbi:Accelerated cell death 11 [Bienertia sinuspersici]
MAEGGGEKPLRKIAEAFKDLAITVNSQDLISMLPHFLMHVPLSPPCLVKDLSETSDSILTLQALIDQDIQNNTVRKQGSHTRNLLRVKRGLDMVKVLFEQIIATEGDSLKDAATNAYAQVFAPYHGWAIRKAVGAGMYALPTRPQLMGKLNEDVVLVEVMPGIGGLLARWAGVGVGLWSRVGLAGWGWSWQGWLGAVGHNWVGLGDGGHGWVGWVVVVVAVWGWSWVGWVGWVGVVMAGLASYQDSACVQMQHYITSSEAVIGYIDKLFLSQELGIDW